MAGWAVVAIPDRNDNVWKISSEKIPHMTLLFLGEPAEDVSSVRIAEFLEHVATNTLPRFGLSVDRRGVLGDDSADVLFFEKMFTDRVRDARAHLLKNDDISRAYNAIEQYPEWLPHLTLGYPEAPANDDALEYPIQWVNFDRLALWTDEFDGPTYDLKNDFDREVSMSEGVDAVLAHYGVKGMHWGVKRNPDGTTSKTGKRTKSEDHNEAEALKKKRTYEMSNQELRKLNERMQLEQTYSQLMAKEGNSITKGQRYVKDAMSVAKTGQEIYNLANSPAGKAARSAIELALKR